MSDIEAILLRIATEHQLAPKDMGRPFAIAFPWVCTCGWEVWTDSARQAGLEHVAAVQAAAIRTEVVDAVGKSVAAVIAKEFKARARKGSKSR